MQHVYEPPERHDNVRLVTMLLEDEQPGLFVYNGLTLSLLKMILSKRQLDLALALHGVRSTDAIAARVRAVAGAAESNACAAFVVLRVDLMPSHREGAPAATEGSA